VWGADPITVRGAVVPIIVCGAGSPTNFLADPIAVCGADKPISNPATVCGADPITACSTDNPVTLCGASSIAVQGRSPLS
jgi:hypothetical protein